MKLLKNLFLLICFALASCSSINNKPLSPLSISSDLIDVKLVKEFAKSFTKAKLTINEDNLGLEKSLANLDSGKVNLYLTSSELPLQRDDIESFLIAKDGITIVTNPSNPISGLFLYQLKEIFSLQNKSWKAYTNFNQPILVLEHKEDDVSRQALYRAIFGTEASLIQPTIVVTSDKEVLDSLKKFPNSVSYISYSELKEGMKALDIDNIPATRKNIEKGYYPISRNLRVFYKKDKLKDSYDSLKALLEFIYSSKGQDLIASLGYMPLSEDELASIELESSPIKIGVSAPLDGPYSDLGKSIVNAVKLAVEEVNEAGGIENRKLEIVECNDKANLADAIACAKEFVKDGVVAVVGHLTSQASIETSKIYVDHKIVQISPASTHPWLTERPGARGYVFRTIGRDDRQAKLIATQVSKLDIPHPAKITIMHNNTIYSTTLASLIANEVAKLNVDKVTETTAFKQDKKQYHNEISALKSQVLVFLGEYGDAAQVVKELALSNKKDIVFLGADGTFSQRFIDSAGLRAEGALVTGSTLDMDSQLVQDFMVNFKDRFKMEASAFSMNAYDATEIIIAALKKNLAEGIALNTAVKNTRHLGVTGSIYFNELGDPVLPRMSVYQVQDGKFVRVFE